MKRKFAAALLGMTLAVSSAPVYATETESNEETTFAETDADAKAESDSIYGEVVSVDEDTITIDVGTLKTEDTDSASSGNSTTDSSSEAASDEDSIAETSEDTTSDSDAFTLHLNEDVLSFTGEEKVITLTDDTALYMEDFSIDAAEISDEDAETTDAATAENTDESETETTASEKDIKEITKDSILTGDLVRLDYDENGELESLTILLTDSNVSVSLSDDDTETDASAATDTSFTDGADTTDSAETD